MNSSDREQQPDPDTQKPASGWSLGKFVSEMRDSIYGVLGRKPTEEKVDETTELFDEETAIAMIEMMVGSELSKAQRKELDIPALFKALTGEMDRLGDKFTEENALDIIDRVAPGNVNPAGLERIADVGSTREIIEQTGETKVKDLENLMKTKKILKPVGTIRNKEPRVGRNDPCPCGSGKKHKQCCGRKA